MRKRFSCFLLAILMLLSLAPVAMADSNDTLTVQTRTAQCTFKIGETFTYSYWLRLTPDLVNYSEDYLIEYITGMAGDLDVTLPGTSLGKLQLGTLTKMKLKYAGGNIMYDTDCLSLVSASMPNTKNGYTATTTPRPILRRPSTSMSPLPARCRLCGLSAPTSRCKRGSM